MGRRIGTMNNNGCQKALAKQESVDIVSPPTIQRSRL